jgi:hypothetical protein
MVLRHMSFCIGRYFGLYVVSLQYLGGSDILVVQLWHSWRSHQEPKSDNSGIQIRGAQLSYLALRCGITYSN